MISLSEARKSGRVEQFVEQEATRSIGPIDRAEFDGAVDRVIKERQPKDRTSRYSSADGSTGKKTRRDTDQGASR